MTLYDIMPSVLFLLCITFFLVSVLFRCRLFSAGGGAALFSFLLSLTGCGIFWQAASFFAYLLAVSAAYAVSRASAPKTARGAVAVTRIDSRGGSVLYKGRLYPAYPRDGLYVYRLGDVFKVKETSDGTLFAYRI
ncbi:MAG: hypothetical protein J5879_05880 [Clostridia bacterium]|nr:hypothetical protein [Clostridia bacterium]